MAKYISAAPDNGFTVSEVTSGKSYPAEVDQFVNDPNVSDDPGISDDILAIYEFNKTSA
jgi:hypothetical protein